MPNGEDEYDWKLLKMLKQTNTRKIINKVSDKENWKRKDALDDEFWSTDLSGKI